MSILEILIICIFTNFLDSNKASAINVCYYHAYHASLSPRSRTIHLARELERRVQYRLSFAIVVLWSCLRRYIVCTRGSIPMVRLREQRFFICLSSETKRVVRAKSKNSLGYARSDLVSLLGASLVRVSQLRQDIREILIP